MDVIKLDINSSDWFAFVEAHPDSNIFHHPAWVQFLANCYGYRSFALIVRNGSGKITAGVPFIEIDRVLLGKRLVALPFTDHCAPLYNENSCQLLLELILALYTDTGAKELEIRWDVPLLPSTQIISSYVLHTLNLNANAEQIFRQFQPAHRRNIKTAQNSDLRVERGTGENYIRQFYRLHLETRQRQGVPIQPWRFFQLLSKKLLEPGYGFVLLAFKDRECIASAVFLHWKKTLIYKYGASRESMLAYRPNNLLMWVAIQWGCENGFTLFDMGRTDLDNPGLCRFKKGWGADERLLTYSLLSSKPHVLTASKIENIMRPVIRKSPSWVCRVAGEMLYRYFG